jgi:hypothetical protein
MTISGLLKNAVRLNSPLAKSRGHIIQAFAKKLGLVYFGAVDQHLDDFEVIRGFTVSTTHQDSHYAVGGFDGYDISLVDRFDVVVDREGAQSSHRWLIMQIDLTAAEPLPHTFLLPIDPHQSYDKLFRAYSSLQAVNTMLTGAHSPEFHGRYQLYTAPTHAMAIEEFFTPAVTQQIATRLWPHAVEIADNKLYLYTSEESLTATTLDSAVESALWLARTLDKNED